MTTNTTRTILLASAMLAGFALCATDDAQARPRFGGMSGPHFAPKMAPRQAFAPVGNRSAQLPRFNRPMAMPRWPRDPRINGGARPSFDVAGQPRITANPNTVPVGPTPRSGSATLPTPRNGSFGPRSQGGNMAPPVRDPDPDEGRPAQRRPASPVPFTIPGVQPQLPRAATDWPPASGPGHPHVGAPGTPPSTGVQVPGSSGGRGINPAGKMKGRPDINIDPRVLNPEWRALIEVAKMIREGRLVVPPIIPNTSRGGDGAQAPGPLPPGYGDNPFAPGAKKHRDPMDMLRIFGSDGSSSGGNGSGPRSVGGVPTPFGDPNSEASTGYGNQARQDLRKQGFEAVDRRHKQRDGSYVQHFRAEDGARATITERDEGNGSKTTQVDVVSSDGRWRYSDGVRERGGQATGDRVIEDRSHATPLLDNLGNIVWVGSVREVRHGHGSPGHLQWGPPRPVPDRMPSGDDFGGGGGGGSVCLTARQCVGEMLRAQRRAWEIAHPGPGGMPTERPRDNLGGSGPGPGAVTDPNPMGDGPGGSGGSAPPDPCRFSAQGCGSPGGGGSGPGTPGAGMVGAGSHLAAPPAAQP
jgi:hypothetical protein